MSWLKFLLVVPISATCEWWPLRYLMLFIVVLIFAGCAEQERRHYAVCGVVMNAGEENRTHCVPGHP